MLLTLLCYALMIGLFAVVYRHILSDEPVLNWWFMFGLRFEHKWFYKPIWGCELCIAGQLALWTYALNWISTVISPAFWPLSDFIFFLVPTYHLNDYSVLQGFIFITEAIASAFLFYKGFLKLKVWQQNLNG